MKHAVQKIIALVTLTAALTLAAPTQAATYYGGSYLVASSYYVNPGQTVTVHGYRFYPHENVMINHGGMSTTIQADGSGHFAHSLKVPKMGARESSLVVTAAGSTSGATHHVRIVVSGFYPVVSANPYFVYRGDNIFFGGHGFGSSEMITIRRNGSQIGTLQASGGSFGISINQPTAGNHTYTFTGDKTGAQVMVMVHVGEPWWTQ